jgi:penicillin-binding protein 1A
MARSKAAERQEPRFDGGSAGGDQLRLRPEDRPAPIARPRSKAKPKPDAPAWDTEDGGPPDRGRRGGGGGSGRGGGGGGGRKRRGRRRKRSLIGGFVYWSFVLAVWAFLGVAGVIAWYAAHLPPMSELEVPERPPNIAIVGTTGEVLVNRGAMGQAVRLAELPRHLPQAVIAIEDRRFYSHYGMDPIGVARALVRNVSGGGVAEGGSTLTQQLAKNIFLTNERTFGRKVQELILALWLEARYSKDQILEMYLNRVYLGAGAYGVEGAAQRYFGKSARQVTLQEAAVLAGLLQAPSRFAPTRNPDLAMTRARVVLRTMVEAGFVRQMDAMVAGTAPLRVRPADPSGNSIQYAADWVMDLLPTMIGTVDTDVIVETTIDPGLQAEAEKALREALDREGQRFQVGQGAVVTIDVNGAVRALVGGRSYAESQFNRAVAARRQPGSAFKTFVYLAALERGLTPDTRRDDAPVDIAGWSPENFTRDHRGSVTLRDALALSLNTVAARLGQEVGPAAVVRTAQRLGVASPLQAIPSIALGTSEVSPLELARAYVPLANGGVAVAPYVVREIRTASGRVLFRRTQGGAERAARSEHVAMMNHMLARAVEVGTARNARVQGWNVAGKTGTSQDFRDAWFVGYTAQFVTAVWVGNDDNSPTRRASGGGIPTTIWSRVMALAHQGLPPLSLPGAGQPLPAPDRPAPRSIDDILIGAPSAARDGASPNFDLQPRTAQRTPAPQGAPQPAARTGQQGWGGGHGTSGGGCPLDGNFLACVFGQR